MRTIKLTPTEIEKVQDETAWTPFWFETNHGMVTVPGPTDDDEGWEDFYEEVASRLEDSMDTYPCGCCECCGCDCWYDEIDDDWDYDYDDDEPTLNGVPISMIIEEEN
jgi:hypothetical protein